MNSLKAKVLKTIHKYDMILPGEKVVLGVSGGPDSMALLYALYALRGELGCTLHIAHLDHKLRGEESAADARYVAEHAKKLALPITLEAIDVHGMIEPKESVESGARRIRYDFYERVVAEVKGNKVALGHNADDQAETIMMRLLRGSGAQGLSGIPPVRDNKFIRPIIEISRSEIEEYLSELRITARQDLTNLSTDYERNKMRHELLPLLEREYSPNVKRILCQTGELLREEDDLLNVLAREVVENCAHYPDAQTAVIQIPHLKQYHLAIQRRIMRFVIRELIGDLRSLDYDHIRDLLNLALCGISGSVISLPRGITAGKSYDELIIRCGDQPETAAGPFRYRIEVPGETKIPNMIIKTSTQEKTYGSYDSEEMDAGKFQAVLDYGKISGDLHVRNRRAGDRFHPLGMSGTKKLKNFLIDEKVPRSSRDSIPILTDGDNNILWVIGYRMDDRFKVTAETKTQLVVSAISD